MHDEILCSSIFGELTRQIQIRFDTASEMHKRIFDNVIYERFLDWDSPTIGLDIEEIIGQYNITIAAPTIGENSKEAIIGSEGLQTLKERIVRHALTLPMLDTTYRKILQLLDSKSLSDAAKKEQLVKLMWGDVMTVVNAIHGKLDMIFLGCLSNEGKFELNATTNPEGGVRGVIDMNQPDENIATSKTAWTAANIDTVDCFEDIQQILEAAQDKVTLSKILCAPSKIAYMCRSKKLKQMIFGTDKSSSVLLLRHINEWMQSNDFPVFEQIKRQVRIQKGRQYTPYTPWNADNLVFVPDGKLGLVKNAWATNELKKEAGVAYSNYGRIRVSQWGVGETQNSNGVEFTKAESLSLPVITEMNGIYTLKTAQ